ncbi:hypothetical protein [Streptomyces sp. NPDC004783]|uniref:hypothetical protein n=1 Tax=unclassified Streptomyces TaxID=2593676 RepID=UPI0033B6B76D
MKAKFLAAAGLLATTALTGAGSAHAAPSAPAVTTINLNHYSYSGNSYITGTYSYWQDGTDAEGYPKYDGKFTNVKLTDVINNNGLGAALVLSYDELRSDGYWYIIDPYISRTGSDGTTSWNFNDKDRISAWVCDYNSSRDFNSCRNIFFNQP